tara:strand:+ start:40 stop:321 length:282 start_codon:yes stop_codon:yes gene_type:complete
MIKYPEVQFQLVGIDGNAFSILGKAQKEARRAGLSKEQIEEYVNEATSGDYNNVISTTMKFFDCSGQDECGWNEDEDEYDEDWLDGDMEDDDE